jgi:hypothetical protein
MNHEEINKMSGFGVPDGYFENSKRSILNAIKPEVTSMEFEVPEGYFEKSKVNILEKTKETKVVSIFSWKRILIYAGSAAAVALLIWQIGGSQQQEAQPSFADLLDQTDLNEEQVLEDATLEEMLNYYSSEIEVLISDTTKQTHAPQTIELKTDSIQKMQNPNKKTKPTKKKDHPTIKELSEEEILKYLIEEGGDSYEIQ